MDNECSLAVEDSNDLTTPPTSEKLYDSFLNLSKDFKDFNGPIVTEIEGPPTSLEFLRKYVSRNLPVIFRNAASSWPAVFKWNYDYICSKLQDKLITVAATPHGYADAVIGDIFMLPEEIEMTFDAFIKTLRNPEPHTVYYIQKQCNNLIEEFSCLLDDVGNHVPWASEALGREPDAANFWMGDERAITSLHKDHYENIYIVIRGIKEFILHPPTDLPWLPYHAYPMGQYHLENGRFEILHLNKKIRWIPVNPAEPDFEKYPCYRNSTKLHCVVKEGDVFYLPSLWYHHVSQSHGCIAVNYWYDMDFDVKYCFVKFLERLWTLYDKRE